MQLKVSGRTYDVDLSADPPVVRHQGASIKHGSITYLRAVRDAKRALLDPAVKDYVAGFHQEPRQ